MKIGDKVRIIKAGSVQNDEIGLIYSKTEIGNLFVGLEFGGIGLYSENEIELVEEATYIPVPKFKVGDIVWFKGRDEKIYNGLVVKGRDIKMKYKLFVENYHNTNIYTAEAILKDYRDSLVDVKESELSKEKPE